TIEWYQLNQLELYRQYVMLLGVFGGVGLVLAIVGIYGIMAHSVTQRTGEIGIRMALGAGSSRVLALVLRRGVDRGGPRDWLWRLAGAHEGDPQFPLGRDGDRSADVCLRDSWPGAGGVDRLLHPGAPGAARQSCRRAEIRVETVRLKPDTTHEQK